MSNRSSSGNDALVWWAVVAVAVAGVMVLKGLGVVAWVEWKWVAAVVAVVMGVRLWGLLRSSSTSPGRIFLLVAVAVAVCSVGVVGIPAHWLRIPEWSEVSAVVTPLLLGAAGVVVVVLGLAWLNRRREMEGAPQRSYVPIILNLIIVVAAWHVVRQPLWRESLQGMMKLPQLHSNRVALEETIAPWMDLIEDQEGASGGPRPLRPARGEPAAGVASASERAAVERGKAIGEVVAHAPRTSARGMPANAEQWINAAVHNKQDPMMELKASAALVAEGRTEQALSRLAAARVRGCQSPELVRYHAQLLRQQERPAAAAAVLETLAISPEGTTQDLQDALHAWEKAGQLDRAESLAERAMVRRPSRELFRWLATRETAAGRHERALHLLGQLSRRAPFDPADAFQLAEVALSAGRPELALDAVNRLEEAGHRSARTARVAARARASAIGDSALPPPRPGS